MDAPYLGMPDTLAPLTARSLAAPVL